MDNPHLKKRLAPDTLMSLCSILEEVEVSFRFKNSRILFFSFESFPAYGLGRYLLCDRAKVFRPLFIDDAKEEKPFAI